MRPRTQFAALLHSLNVPYFSTVWYYNELLKDVVPALRCITDREAVNVGTFLYETFKTLNYWRSSEEVRGGGRVGVWCGQCVAEFPGGVK